MTLEGKGFFIWQIRNCENGDPKAIANLAVQANFTHILIKIANGTLSYNVDPSTGADLVPPLVKTLHDRKIQAWGWHYIYGIDPVGEANKAIQRVKQLGLNGYVIDAEAEYQAPGKDKDARVFMSQLRSGLPNFPVALCSYRYPSYHPQFPWQAFLEKCDLNMPQVYWMQNHNPGEQLIRCVNEFKAMIPYRPIIPVGAAFEEDNWAATPDDEMEFLKTAQTLNLSAANFWEWANCREYLPEVWNTIRDYPWPTSTNPDITQAYIAALNTHDLKRVVSLYDPNGVHVTPSRTVKGSTAINAWYDNLFKKTLPNATFTLTSFDGAGSSRHTTWTATSSNGKVYDGSDTFGLLDGKITYHYTWFTIS